MCIAIIIQIESIMLTGMSTAPKYIPTVGG